jgi:hypothetical protein
MNERLIDIEPTSAPLEDPVTREQRAIYKRRLAEKLKDPEFRKIEGFPIGTDEAILALSDPPFYTACPNPFLEEWLEENAKPYDPVTDTYHREPFAADVSEGKNHPIYNAHSYHTKVPHRAIMRYILHYTEPGDVVYDGFCGTGMTGVAAQLCGDKAEVEELGSDLKKGKRGDYKVDEHGNIWDRESWESHQALRAGQSNPNPFLSDPKPFSKLGVRKAVLNDLSPAATFISYNYNTPVVATLFEFEAKRILTAVEKDLGWMYAVLHREKDKWTDAEWEEFVSESATEISRCKDADSGRECVRKIGLKAKLGRLNYLVWSDVFLCPVCGTDFIYWEAAIEGASRCVLEKFPCPNCQSELTKGACERKRETLHDPLLARSVSHAVQAPVLKNYTASKRFESPLDEFDRALIDLTSKLSINSAFSTAQLPAGYNTEQPKRTHGFTHAHHFFFPRTRLVIEQLRSQLEGSANKPQILLAITSFLQKTGSKLHNIGLKDGAINLAGAVPNVLAVNAAIAERNIFELMTGKVADLAKAFGSRTLGASLVNCKSSTELSLTLQADYIFVDPPFGGNLMYSELNFLWECLLEVVTNNSQEAITNSVQKKGLADYQELIRTCFERFYVALKPGRWMTVEFHNSADAVWNAIQEALERVGFIVADVRVLDKVHYTHKQVTSSGATKKDLVISCYKPDATFSKEFQQDKGTVQGVNDFLEQHLGMLPVAPITANGKLEQIAERTLGVLFDRMIAYHLVQGALIPLNAVEFETLLANHFFKEDGMWFLANQLAQYQARKMRGAEPEQLSFYVQDEKSAIRWVRSQLEEKSQTLGELVPKFMLELKEWPKSEPRPELRDLIKEYFIQNADGSWAIPDPENEEHLSTLRCNMLLKLFKGYATEKGKLGSFRKEAVIEGYKHCWQTKQFHIIVRVSERIKPADLQADRELLQFYDIAKDMIPDATAATAEYVS